MGFLLALRFLTALPLPPREVTPGELGRSMAYYPLVGALLGLTLAGTDSLLQYVFPSSVTSAILLVVLILLTGGLHLDGLMDSCDGLFGRRDPARRLEIMRDSRVGSFGVLGAVGLLIVMYTALSALAAPWRTGALVLMPVMGRWAMVLALWGFPYARAEGLGRSFKEEVGWREVLAATVLAAAVAALSLGVVGIGILFITGTGAWLLGSFIFTRIPGLTGDSYGAINGVVEVVSLLTVVAVARAGYG